MAAIVWYYTHDSGIHATIAGVALGLSLPSKRAAAVTHILQPLSNALILPLFALVSASVPIPAVGPLELSPVFWGICIGLPVGKIIGITVVGYVGSIIARRGGAEVPSFPDIVVIGVLGGIGFTVSLLMNGLAFSGNRAVIDEGTLAVLVGSGIAMMASAVLVSFRARHYRLLSRQHPVSEKTPAGSPFAS